MLQRPNTNIISIDLGHPIDKSDVLENVINFKFNSNNYKYLKGNSQSLEMQQQVISELKKQLATHSDRIHILFIDGDHSREGVIADFYTYKELVASNGFIVFDDYQDAVHSPEVKIAVDEIVNTFITTPLQENKPIEYAIVGCLPNALGAHPSDLKEGNCFIIKKIR
jgi:cephalosporin hydroxylase